jgi:hypothetical protein
MMEPFVVVCRRAADFSEDDVNLTAAQRREQVGAIDLNRSEPDWRLRAVR